MKYFGNVNFIWHLSVIVLIFKLCNAAMVNNLSDNATNTGQPQPAETSRFSNSRHPKKLNLGACQDGISLMCIKMEIVQYIERLSEKDEINLLPGLEIVKSNDVLQSKPADMIAEIAQKYPNDPSSRLNGYIISKLTNYMQSHFLRLKLVDDKVITEARSLSESARSKGKKGGGMEALIAAGIAMKGTLMAIALGALALLAGKALTAALMALVLSGIVGLKSMDGGKEVKYEIISKPIHSASHKHDDHHSAYAAYGRNYQLETPSH